MCNVQTGWESMGGNTPGAGKHQERICPGGKLTGGNISGWRNNWREYVWVEKQLAPISRKRSSRYWCVKSLIRDLSRL